MKKKNFQELRQKDIKSLEKMVAEKKHDLLVDKVNIKASKEKNLKVIRNTRHDLARILTLIREKELAAGEEK